MAALVEPRIFQKLSVDEDDARHGGFGCCSYGGARLVLHVMDHSSKTLAACVLSREGNAKHYVTTITLILAKVGDAIRAFSRYTVDLGICEELPLNLSWASRLACHRSSQMWML